MLFGINISNVPSSRSPLSALLFLEELLLSRHRNMSSLFPPLIPARKGGDASDWAQFGR